jgi:tetratricopeptide (TPR) repeat protein
MARTKNNLVGKSLLSMGWARWLVFLALIFLGACGGGEDDENVERNDVGEIMRPELAEGLKLTQEQKYDEAISKVFEAVINDPKDAEALGVLSYIYLRSNRLPHAREAAKRALDIDPYQSKPLIVLARVHFVRSGFEEVLDLARKALTINPEAADAYQIIGEVYLRQGLTKDALMVLKEAVRLDPENPELLNILGSAYIKLKQYDRALSTLMALQEIDPNNPGAHFNLAMVYAKMKEGRKAMRHITRAEYLYAQDKDDLDMHWLGKARDIRRVIAKDFKLRPEDINKRVSMN